MKHVVSVSTLLGWVYGGDYPMRASGVGNGKLVVLHEDYDGAMDIHIWTLDEHGSVPVEVDMDDSEELNTDSYHGHTILTEPETIRRASLSTFVSTLEGLY